MRVVKTGEYALKGDYHVHLNPDWPYLPVYLAKLELIRKILGGYSPKKKMIDLGSGEGVVVKEFSDRGNDIVGLDLNNESKYVIRGDLRKTAYKDASFDVVLRPDVLEHVQFSDQEVSFIEIARILKPGGIFIFASPNLSHFALRLSFLVRGKLLRTSSIERHPGDRPIGEFLRIIKESFIIKKRYGILLTFPIISYLTIWKLSSVLLMHRIYNKLFSLPGFCFLNLAICERKSEPVENKNPKGTMIQ
jgi:SAM-dependent methyltransferase